jgi:DNA-binding transcriptional ArsR family regulator
MEGISRIAGAAAMIGDPARANMLYALKNDGWVSAGDLAAVAGVAPSTASEHLGRLLDAGMIRMRASGRRRYYALATPKVAEVMEGVESLARALESRAEPARWDRTTIHARFCLDHLAGHLGGRLAGAAFAGGFAAHTQNGPRLLRKGAIWLHSIGVDVAALRAEPRRFLSLCPDWNGDLPHLGGAVSAAMLRALLQDGWLRRVPGRRQAQVTPRGVARFRADLGLDVRAPDAGEQEIV